MNPVEKIIRSYVGLALVRLGFRFLGAPIPEGAKIAGWEENEREVPSSGRDDTPLPPPPTMPVDLTPEPFSIVGDTEPPPARDPAPPQYLRGSLAERLQRIRERPESDD